MQKEIELNATNVLNSLATVYALQELPRDEAQNCLSMMYHLWRTRKEMAPMEVFFDCYFAFQGDFGKMERLLIKAIPKGSIEKCIEMAKEQAKEQARTLRGMQFCVDIQVQDSPPKEEAAK